MITFSSYVFSPLPFSIYTSYGSFADVILSLPLYVNVNSISLFLTEVVGSFLVPLLSLRYPIAVPSKFRPVTSITCKDAVEFTLTGETASNIGTKVGVSEDPFKFNEPLILIEPENVGLAKIID